jgi:hypothetical protein
MIKGRCECDRVQFAVDGEIVDFSHCHCLQCRRLHGAAYATFAGVKRDLFSYSAGANEVKVYASSTRNDRVFCGNCGSTILVKPIDEPEFLYLSMSAIEGEPVLPQGYHAWVDSKAYWHEIADDLEKFERNSD